MPKEIIFIFVFIVIITDVVTGDCYKEGELMQRCFVSAPVFSTSNNSYPITREQLDESCVELRNSLQCIDNYTEVCMGKVQRAIFRNSYSGITEVVNELCTPGKYQDEYFKHAVCLKKVQPEYEVCSENYVETLARVASQRENDDNGQVSQDTYIRTVCCSFQEYLMCSERTVHRMCGDDAALFTSAFLKRMASNIIKIYCLEYTGKECGLTNNATSTEHTNKLHRSPEYFASQRTQSAAKANTED